MTEEEKIEAIILILNRGNDVRLWPEDEAAAYREFRFSEGNAAADRIRAKKILDIANG